jgi:FkbM family methyltransferase
MINPNLFISYAQNFEDVLLWRALKNITNGFYIDVGANDPKIDSVTKAFYDAGWSGINIEPVVRFYEELQNHRPRDLNLNCAASSEAGKVTIYDVDVRGWATLEKSVADNFTIKGKKTTSYPVKARTLKDICQEHAKREIHFLKIDVEGFELEVLKGADFTVFRPWIVVVESTQPDSQVENYETWEEILIKSDYSFAFFDGINRYYIALEHSELDSHFKCPPNVFDAFIKSNHFEALISAQQFQEEMPRAEARATQAEARATQAEARATQAEAKLANLISSQSWKFTAPLRALNDFLLFHKKRGIRFYLKQNISRIESFVRRRPVLNQFVLKLLDAFPGIQKFLILQTASSSPRGLKPTQNSSNLDNLSPHARGIYHRLKAEIDRHQTDSKS